MRLLILGIVMLATSIGLHDAIAADADSQSAAEAAALAQPDFNAPVRVVIGRDASSQIPRIEALKGRFNQSGGFTQSLGLFLPIVLASLMPKICIAAQHPRLHQRTVGRILQSWP